MPRYLVNLEVACVLGLGASIVEESMRLVTKVSDAVQMDHVGMWHSPLTALPYLTSSEFWTHCGNLKRLQIRHGTPDIETTQLIVHRKSQKQSAAILIHVSIAPETAAARHAGRGRNC